MDMRRATVLMAWLAAAACNNSEVTSATDDSAADDTAATAEPTTGPTIDACDPGLAPIPESEFAERFATAICEQKSACGCAVDFSCALDFIGGFQRIHSDGQNLGLTYDGDCAARKLAGLVQARNCDMASEIDLNLPCSLNCLVYRGSTVVGQACTSPPALLTALFADLCASPGNCSANTCKPPLSIAADGQPCFDPLARCKQGSTCDFKDSKLCEPLVGEGKPCTGNGVCNPDLYCGGEGTCIARGLDGAACTTNDQCATLRCTDGKCEDWRWICEVAEGVDIFGRHPEDF